MTGPILSRMLKLANMQRRTVLHPPHWQSPEIDDCHQVYGDAATKCPRCGHEDAGTGFYQCPHYNGREKTPCPLDVDFPGDREARR